MKKLNRLVFVLVGCSVIIVVSNCCDGGGGTGTVDTSTISDSLWRDCTQVNIDTFCIVTWNAREIFTSDEVVYRTSDLQNFASTLNPDIILLQEFTSEAVLEDIRDAMGLNTYHIASSDFVGGTSYGSFEVGVISRFPIQSYTEYDPSIDDSENEEELTTLTEYGIDEVGTSRGFIVVNISEINLFVIPFHLKSSLGNVGTDDADNARKREKVAAYAAMIVNELKENHPYHFILVAGDFNVGHSDEAKNGSNLAEDCYSDCAESDLYDETHALLGGGLIENLEMVNLALDITESTYPSYPGSPIDNMYVDGKNKTSFTKAVRVSNTFGSDHTPVYAMYSPASNLYNSEVVVEPVTPESDVRIIRLLPNPVGDESINESATIKNFSDATVSLAGWMLKDDENTTLPLDVLVDIAPDEEKTIQRNGASLAMANSGDVVMLVDADDNIVHQVEYTSTTSGEEIVFD